LPSLTFSMSFINHDFLGLEGIAPMHQRDMLGDIGEIQRFFDGRIATANNGDILAFVEKTVAGRATGNPFAHEGLFGGKPRYMAEAPVAMINASQV
jgi:hypothetical protein